MSDPVRAFYDNDVREKWYGAHTVPYEEFFVRMRDAYSYYAGATQDAKNQVYVKGPLAGLSGTDIVRLWEWDS